MSCLDEMWEFLEGEFFGGDKFDDSDDDNDEGNADKDGDNGGEVVNANLIHAESQFCH